MPKLPSHLVDLARRGAKVRLRELAQEAKNLVDLFPDIRDSFDEDDLPLPFIIARDSGSRMKATARRKPMSAAAKKAASRRMKKYWAEKRKAPKA